METDTPLQIARIDAYRYQIPLKRPYGTARGRTTQSTNFVVSVTARRAGETYRGYGESQPRHVLTGDGAKDRHSAWQFLCHALDSINEFSLVTDTPEAGLESIRDVMAELTALARQEATQIHGDKPFRGTLLGIEIALLDVVSRSLDLRISQLLGEKRQEIQASISTISTTTSATEVADKAARLKRFPMTRLKGAADLEENILLLREATRGNRSIGADKPLWIDLNEAMSFDESCAFVEAATGEITAGSISPYIVIEGPLPKREGVRHADLQRFADDVATRATGEHKPTIEIMPDESMWDVDDLRALTSEGGCRAINVKAPKAGGLLASLDLAEAAVAADANVKICIGGMLGTSELTAWALHNLARAMPRIDYLTTVPPRNVEPIASPRSAYVQPDSSVIAPQARTGLGTDLDMKKLQPFLVDAYSVGTATTQAPKTDVPHESPDVQSHSNKTAARAPGRRHSWRILVDGPGVQRVGYRLWLQKLATRNHVSGWVRNRSDGAVEALLRGDNVSLNRVMSRLSTGPAAARIERLEFQRTDTVPHKGFRVRDDAVVQRSGIAWALRKRAQRLVSSVRRPTPGRNPDENGSDNRNSSSDATHSEPADEVHREASLPDIGRVLDGEWLGTPDPHQTVRAGTFLVDQLPESALLVVMDGPSWTSRLQKSAHQYGKSSERIIAQGAARSAVAAVTTKRVENPPIPVHVVEDSREAQWQIGTFARNRYTKPVVGITGTVGKSTTTDLLSHVLSQNSRVHRSQGNWNTIDGVANTLGGLLGDSDLAVVEAAISGFVRVPGRSSAEMIRPDIAMVTAIGTAHLDVAPTIEDTAKIKGKLLEAMTPGGTAIINADAPHLDLLRAAADRAGPAAVRTFGRAVDADYRLVDWTAAGHGSRVTAVIEGRPIEYTMNSIGEGVVFNSLGVMAAARAIGRSVDDVVSSLATYVAKQHVTTLHDIPVEGGHACLIDDSTNATVLSMNAGIELLAKLAAERRGRAVAVLGQINYLGNRAEEIHASLAEPLSLAGVEALLTMGEGMNALRQAMGPEICGAHATSPRELVDEVRQILRPGDVVLVKGSNVGTGFRRVASSLVATSSRKHV